MDFEKRVATTEPVVKSLSTKNESLKNKVVILAIEAKNDKERVTTLEKCLQVEKDFSKLKDKPIGDKQFKMQKNWTCGSAGVQGIRFILKQPM